MEAYITDRGYEEALYPIKPFNENIDTQESYSTYLRTRERSSIKAAALIRLALDDGPLL